MKLTRISGIEQTVKHSFSFKQSTSTLLQKYVEFYRAETNVEVSVKDVAEQILLDFMADDKAFQRFIRQAGSSAAAPAAPAEPQVPDTEKVTADPAPTELAPIPEPEPELGTGHRTFAEHFQKP